MDVTDEIRGILITSQKNLNIIYVDKDKEPFNYRKIWNKENGMIALVRRRRGSKNKEDHSRKRSSSAKRILKKLDEVFRENLLKLTQDASTIYFTTGHGEMVFKKEKDVDPDRTISYLKRALRKANFTTKELSIANGLANEIPEDAGVILILAPQLEFSEAEISTIGDFWRNGGAVFIALEPNGADINHLQELGLKYLRHPWLIQYLYARISKSNCDKRNIVTNKFSTHPIARLSLDIIK